MNAQHASIHPTAIIGEGAIIGAGTSIGPYSVIGPKVVLGIENKIGPHVVIEGNTRIGNNNQIFQFASIGAAPQDLKFKGEDSVLEIGDSNRIREYVTLQPGTERGGMISKIGSRNLFMANSHLGHDGIVGDDNVIANSVALAGHVTIGSRIILGGLSGVHQFVRVGDFAMVGAGAMVTQDAPPCCIVQGDRARLVGINTVGLERAGYTREEIKAVRDLYKKLFLTTGPFRERLAKARSEDTSSRAASMILSFFTDLSRGVMDVRSAHDIE